MFVLLTAHFLLFVLFLTVHQRDELKCPSLPNACTCTSEGTGSPGSQGPVVRAAWHHAESCQQPVQLEALRVSITAFRGKNFIIPFKSWNHFLNFHQELPVNSSAVNVLEMCVCVNERHLWETSWNV